MEEEELNYRQEQEQRLRASIWGTLGVFKIAAQIIDIYVPKVLETMILAAGGRSQDSPDRAAADPSRGIGGTKSPRPGKPDDDPDGKT